MSLPACGADPVTPQGDSRIIEVAGRSVHVWEAGTGPAVILIHGAGGNLRDFTFDLAPRLAETYRVIAFDRPGLGLSDDLGRGHDSPTDQATVLSLAARELGVDQAVIVGHSYGGSVAMAWALTHPDQAAAVVSLAGSVQPWDGGLGAYYRIMGAPISGALAAPLLANLATDGMAESAIRGIFEPDPVPVGYIAHIRPELTLRSRVLRANARQVNTLLPHVTAMSERYPNLTLPIEIVHGSADEIVPLQVHSRRLAAEVTSTNLVVLEGVGHMPHHTNPEAVLAAIDRAARRAGLR